VMIGAGSVVTKNVSDFAVMAGNPAIQQGWISKAGASLDFRDSNETHCSIQGTKYILNNDLVVATD